MENVLINCDLGENEDLNKTERLLRMVDAANICCGVHAGSRNKTYETIEIAHDLGVLIGAHPGIGAAGGRGEVLPTVEGFKELLKRQVGDFLEASGRVGAKMSYVKVHGSLYHAVERDGSFQQAYLEFLRDAGCGVFALSMGSFARTAEAANLELWHEAFLDRGYEPTGALVSRGKSGALLSIDASIDRYKRWRISGAFEDCEGALLRVRADTLCIHSDSEESETLLARIRELGSH